MNESVILKELSQITYDCASAYEIHRLSALLSSSSLKAQAKALWILGEIGLRNPHGVVDYIGQIAAFLHSSETKLRERSLNALGRIDRGDFCIIRATF